MTLLDGSRVKIIREEGPHPRRAIRHKRFWIRRESGVLENMDRVEAARFPLYNADAALGSEPDRVVVICEGIPAVDALSARGLPAVGTVVGGLRVPAPAALEPLRGHAVVLWPDNDDSGVAHMARLTHALRAVDVPVTGVIRWMGGPYHGDAADFDGSSDELAALVNGAEPWSPGLLDRASAPARIRTIASPLSLQTDVRLGFEQERWV